MLATITDEHRAWGLTALRNTPFPQEPRRLSGFIAEAALIDYLRDNLLLDAQHGPKYRHDIIVEEIYRAEVKTSCGTSRYNPDTWVAWIPRYQPGYQHLLICCYLWLPEVTIDAVLQADQVVIRGWIHDERVPEFPILRKGEPCAAAAGRRLDVDTWQIPDAELTDIRVLGALL